PPTSWWSDRVLTQPVQVLEGAGPASATLFLDSAFNLFQAKAQGKRLVTFSAGEGSHRVALTLGGAESRWACPVTGAFGGVAASGQPDAAAVSSVVDSVTAWLRAEPAAVSGSIRLPPDGLGQLDSPI